MKKISLILLPLFLIATSGIASVTVSWGTSGTTFAFDSTGLTKLPATGSSSTAGFCQLLWIGTAYDGFSGTGVGTMGDDVVVATSYLGTGAMSAAGTIGGSFNNTSYAIGSQFIIRFFDSPTSNYGSGTSATVPSSGYYGLSQVIVSAKDPFGTPDSENFYFNANYSATIAVPEPSTVLLMVAGLGVLGFRRFRK